jgi:hypothetical protein
MLQMYIMLYIIYIKICIRYINVICTNAYKVIYLKFSIYFNFYLSFIFKNYKNIFILFVSVISPSCSDPNFSKI